VFNPPGSPVHADGYVLLTNTYDRASIIGPGKHHFQLCIVKL
jgi:hypothetical protein